MKELENGINSLTSDPISFSPQMIVSQSVIFNIPLAEKLQLKLAGEIYWKPPRLVTFPFVHELTHLSQQSVVVSENV